MIGSRERAVVTGMGASALFGTWAAIVHRNHDAGTVARACLVQGALSFVTTTCAALLLEYLVGLGRSTKQRVALGAIVTPSIIFVVVASVHVAAGTPNVLATLIPSWFTGTIFAVAYTHQLLRVARSSSGASGSSSKARQRTPVFADSTKSTRTETSAAPQRNEAVSDRDGSVSHSFDHSM